jgi:signal transduction histidine kinase
VLETSSAIRNAEGEIAELRGIVKDITERINAEKTQMQMNIKLTDANRKLKLTQSRLVQQEKLASIGQLAAGVAHEINNPLGFVKSNYGSLKNYVDELYSYVAEIEAELMSKAPSEGEALIRHRREVNQLDFIVEDIQSIFEESDQGFERIIAIVRGLRNFSRKDARGEKAEYDLNAALDDALVMARNELKYVADVTKDYGRIPKVECHVDEINQVLLNVIINAAQAIKAGEYGEKRNVTVRTRSGHNEVVCEISDEGTGIPGDLADKIFDPFFTTKEIGKGTGLGLSISYDIVVNRHGGELSVTSTPGKGSTFTIKLPVRRDTT